MNRLKIFTLISISNLIFLSACTSNEIGNSKDVNPDAIFFDYKIWAEEGRESVTVNLQYRMGGPNGTTLVIDEPGSVKLDGEELQLDSAKLTGAYYEVQKSLDSFTGKHTIVFTDLNKKEYREEFEFTPFTLEPDVPATLTRGNLVFNLKGLDPIDYVRVLATDTSFTSTDINDVDTVRNGRLVISSDRLSSLVNGPVNLEFYKEVEKPLKNTAKEGGKLFLTYGLKREFELKGPHNP
ncbi:MAG: hypothetical protein EPN92_13050 [Chitinophagaceae bacterium]|nr:MAG: hypothetical protein EPN92_13050 [Chitinophagaceae bacterium]